jgi:hypothetical protein
MPKGKKKVGRKKVKKRDKERSARSASSKLAISPLSASHTSGERSAKGVLAGTLSSASKVASSSSLCAGVDSAPKLHVPETAMAAPPDPRSRHMRALLAPLTSTTDKRVASIAAGTASGAQPAAAVRLVSEAGASSAASAISVAPGAVVSINPSLCETQADGHGKERDMPKNTRHLTVTYPSSPASSRHSDASGNRDVPATGTSKGWTRHDGRPPSSQPASRPVSATTRALEPLRPISAPTRERLFSISNNRHCFRFSIPITRALQAG